MIESSMTIKRFFLLFLISSSLLFIAKTQAAVSENHSFNESIISNKKAKKIYKKIEKLKRWKKEGDKKGLLVLGTIFLVIGIVTLVIGLAGALACTMLLSSCGGGTVTIGLLITLFGLSLTIAGAA